MPNYTKIAHHHSLIVLWFNISFQIANENMLEPLCQVMRCKIIGPRGCFLKKKMSSATQPNRKAISIFWANHPGFTNQKESMIIFQRRRVTKHFN